MERVKKGHVCARERTEQDGSEEGGDRKTRLRRRRGVKKYFWQMKT
jgi:hypothetical protein